MNYDDLDWKVDLATQRSVAAPYGGPIGNALCLCAVTMCAIAHFCGFGGFYTYNDESG